MTAALELVYSEYGRDRPPYVWRPRGAADRTAAYEIIADFRRRGHRWSWPEGVCVRVGARILVRTTSGLRDKDGRRHAAIFVISGLRTREDWDGAVADEIADLLEGTGVQVSRPELRRVLQRAADASVSLWDRMKRSAYCRARAFVRRHSPFRHRAFQR